MFWGASFAGYKGEQKIQPKNSPKFGCPKFVSQNSGVPDLFSRRFREGISFPDFVERCIPELPLSMLCTVPLALQNRALFEGKKMAKMCQEKGRKRGGQQKRQKGKKDA